MEEQDYNERFKNKIIRLLDKDTEVLLFVGDIDECIDIIKKQNDIPRSSIAACLRVASDKKKKSAFGYKIVTKN